MQAEKVDKVLEFLAGPAQLSDVDLAAKVRGMLAAGLLLRHAWQETGATFLAVTLLLWCGLVWASLVWTVYRVAAIDLARGLSAALSGGT